MCRGVYLASFLKMNRQVVHQLFVILTFSLPVLLASRVTITDNGYEDIVVAISSSVPADQSETIMANIKVIYWRFVVWDRLCKLSSFFLLWYRG